MHKKRTINLMADMGGELVHWFVRIDVVILAA